MKFGNPFIPTLEQNLGEEVFLPKSPIKLIKAGRYNNIPYIFGFNNKEGGSFIKGKLFAKVDINLYHNAYNWFYYIFN